jgi:hypothetical protein
VLTTSADPALEKELKCWNQSSSSDSNPRETAAGAFAAQRFKDLPDPLLSCPVKALRASLDAARTTEGAVFRPPDGFRFSLSNV